MISSHLLAQRLLTRRGHIANSPDGVAIPCLKLLGLPICGGHLAQAEGDRMTLFSDFVVLLFIDNTSFVGILQPAEKVVPRDRLIGGDTN